MQSSNVQVVLDDAINQLTKKYGNYDYRVELLCKRYFSIIYEVINYEDMAGPRYIVKISTTTRNAKEEFGIYSYLSSLGIDTLDVVVASDRYNYLITVKKNICEFDLILKRCKQVEIKRRYFMRLGILLGDLDKKTSKNAFFNKDEYNKYLLPRLQKIKNLSIADKDKVLIYLDKLSCHIDKTEICTCLVGDFSLGNLHVDKNDNFVLVDMGDSYIDNFYSNIAYIFLNIKFGSLYRYYENKSKVTVFFDDFLTGYGISELKNSEFNLYVVKHLINMINFIEQLKAARSSLIMNFVSSLSNRYLAMRYKKYLLGIVEGRFLSLENLSDD